MPRDQKPIVLGLSRVVVVLGLDPSGRHGRSSTAENRVKPWGLRYHLIYSGSATLASWGGSRERPASVGDPQPPPSAGDSGATHGQGTEGATPALAHHPGPQQGCAARHRRGGERKGGRRDRREGIRLSRVAANR